VAAAAAVAAVAVMVAAAEDATKNRQIQLMLKHTKPGSKTLGSGFIVIGVYFGFLAVLATTLQIMALPS
jgi:hypothetical protein